MGGTEPSERLRALLPWWAKLVHRALLAEGGVDERQDRRDAPREERGGLRAAVVDGPGLGEHESTTRQYALVQRARSLGWRVEDVVVVDEDLGRSGATTEGRGGFARLAGEVARGRVGAFFALEVSRLARSSADWQQLLRLCRITNVVVADEVAEYDPGAADDRLLLEGSAGLVGPDGVFDGGAEGTGREDHQVFREHPTR